MAPEEIADRFAPCSRPATGPSRSRSSSSTSRRRATPRCARSRSSASRVRGGRRPPRCARPGVDAGGALPALFVSLADGLGLRRMAAGDALACATLLLALLRGGQRGALPASRARSAVELRTNRRRRRSTSNHTRVPLVVAVDAPAGRRACRASAARSRCASWRTSGSKPGPLSRTSIARVVVGAAARRGRSGRRGRSRCGGCVRDDLGREEAHRVVEIRVQALADEQPACGARRLRCDRERDDDVVVGVSNSHVLIRVAGEPVIHSSPSAGNTSCDTSAVPVPEPDDAGPSGPASPCPGRIPAVGDGYANQCDP